MTEAKPDGHEGIMGAWGRPRRASQVFTTEPGRRTGAQRSICKFADTMNSWLPSAVREWNIRNTSEARGAWNVVQMQLLTFPPLPWRARVLALTFPVCTFSPLPSATLSTTICMVLCVLPVLYSPAACSSRFPQHSHMYPIDMCILVSFIHSFILPSSLLYSIPLHCCATVYPFS